MGKRLSKFLDWPGGDWPPLWLWSALLIGALGTIIVVYKLQQVIGAM